jgi:hypothetical protein
MEESPVNLFTTGAWRLSLYTVVLLTCLGCTAARTPTTPTPTLRPVREVRLELDDHLDEQGALTQGLTLASDDALARLHLQSGTTIRDENGAPISAIHAISRPLKGLAYEFGPQGASIDPPATLELCYNPADLPPAAQADNPQLGFYVVSESTWSWLDISHDPDKNCVSTEVSQLGTFVLIFEELNAPFKS